MTIILAGGNQDYVVLMSDRRLTSDKGIEDDEANKAIILATPDCRMAIAFTGIARWGKFDTLKWLLSAIKSETESYRNLNELLDNIAENATNTFKAGGLPKDAKLAIVFIGYWYSYQDDPELRCWEISNFDSQTGFEVFSYTPNGSVIFHVAGYTSALSVKNRDDLAELIGKKVGPLGFETKCYSVIQDITRKKPDGVIGQQCTACCIPSAINTNMLCTYYSKYVDSVVYSASSILLGMISESSELYIGNKLSPAIVPKVGRNEPCPCGSGQKYKNCHRRWQYPYLPMRSECTFNQDYKDFPRGHTQFPSGSKFIVETRGAASKRKSN